MARTRPVTTEPPQDTPLQARIRAGRARNQALTDEIKAHIDSHFEKLHARLDKLEKPKK